MSLPAIRAGALRSNALVLYAKDAKRALDSMGKCMMTEKGVVNRKNELIYGGIQNLYTTMLGTMIRIAEVGTPL
jgi:hypothetical protein